MRVFLGLGSNLGDRAANLWGAVCELGSIGALGVRRLSPLYETAPVGPVTQPNYLNAVLESDVRCEPVALLEVVKGIEWRMGRRPGERWGPRIIDIDILLFGNHRVSSPSLTIPHVELWRRRFVLQPLSDLVTEGALGKQVREALVALADAQEVWPYPSPELRDNAHAAPTRP
jgi:2-amino-4-hydroxy-6-hydroxymethyldihydropteridine diphosphokinase